MRALQGSALRTPDPFDYKLDAAIVLIVQPRPKENVAMNGEAGKPQSHIIAALSYLLGFITGLIFLYVEPYNEDPFVRFHARQSIGFSVAWFAINVIMGVFIAVLPHFLSVIFGFILEPALIFSKVGERSSLFSPLGSPSVILSGSRGSRRIFAKRCSFFRSPRRISTKFYFSEGAGPFSAEVLLSAGSLLA